MDNVLRLSGVEQKRLLHAGRRTQDPGTAFRCQLVAKVGGGWTCRKTAEVFHCAVSTVASAVRRYTERGMEGLLDARRNNGTRKVDDEFQQKLRSVLLKSPTDFGWERSTWTRELLCLELEHRGLPLVAVCTMGRALADVGARLGNPKPVVLCPWSRYRRSRRLNELLRLEARASSSEPVFYCDEVDIHLNPKIGPDWMLPGRQRRVVTPGKNAKHYLAGALNATTRKMLWVDAPSKSGALFVKLLWRLAAAHPTARRIHLILDNYIIHSSKKTHEALAQFQGRVVLHFLPPYCPDANRIERVWRDLHANVTRNHRCTSIADLVENAHSYLRAYNRRDQTNPSLRRSRVCLA